MSVHEAVPTLGVARLEAGRLPALSVFSKPTPGFLSTETLFH